MTVEKIVQTQYCLGSEDRYSFTAGDLRALVALLDADGVPDDADWMPSRVPGDSPGTGTTVTFRTRERDGVRVRGLGA